MPEKGFRNLTDVELYRTICGEGPERDFAISHLRELLVRGVSKALAGRYGKPIAIEDIVQESLIRILRTLDQFRGKSAFTTWAMTIAIRVGISELRRRHHADQSLDAFQDDDAGQIEVDVRDIASPPMYEARRELLEVLQELIDDCLTEKQRIVIRAYLSEFSTDGIAQALGMNRNALYKLLHDARVRLKEGFAANGYSADDVLSLLAEETARL